MWPSLRARDLGHVLRRNAFTIMVPANRPWEEGTRQTATSLSKFYVSHSKLKNGVWLKNKQHRSLVFGPSHTERS